LEIIQKSSKDIFDLDIVNCPYAIGIYIPEYWTYRNGIFFKGTDGENHPSLLKLNGNLNGKVVDVKQDQIRIANSLISKLNFINKQQMFDFDDFLLTNKYIVKTKIQPLCFVLEKNIVDDYLKNNFKEKLP
jgi:hypothetical protein